MAKRLSIILSAALVVFGAFWGFTHAVEIRDWYVSGQYEPPGDIKSITEKIKLTQKGKDTFYASTPELNSKESFNDNCPVTEMTIVLGCYSNLKIYIYDISDERLSGVEEVTAAHELLHAVYARLSSKDKNSLNSLIENEISKIKDERVLQLIDEYRKSSPDEILNEAHSIIGTELAEISPELENHYAKYFTSRKDVVAFSQQYESQFSERADQINSYDKELEDLNGNITSLETEITSLKQELDQMAGELNNFRSAGSIEKYNAGVPEYNAKVNEYNAKIDEYKGLVDSYNTIVAKRNEIALEQKDLLKNLDSNLQPISP
ncbi:hypothetical protein DYH10_02370 [Candidatus Saccharibacteria bacterium CPR2]|nr:hypothetical protein [Candidatus Saccharibacteria bacterium CPR2]